MTFNLKRLDDAIDWAIAEDAKGKDSRWNQGIWAGETACGTACCLAGNIVIEAGFKPVFKVYNYLPNGLLSSASTIEDAQGNELDVARVAFVELGLDFDLRFDDLGSAVDQMFSGDNDLLAIKQIRDYIAVLVGEPTRFGFGDLDPDEIEDELWERIEEDY